MLVDRALALMPICAWYASCQSNTTKQFLSTSKSAFANRCIPHTQQRKNGKENVWFPLHG